MKASCRKASHNWHEPLCIWLTSKIIIAFHQTGCVFYSQEVKDKRHGTARVSNLLFFCSFENRVCSLNKFTFQKEIRSEITPLSYRHIHINSLCFLISLFRWANAGCNTAEYEHIDVDVAKSFQTYFNEKHGYNLVSNTNFLYMPVQKNIPFSYVCEAGCGYLLILSLEQLVSHKYRQI